MKEGYYEQLGKRATESMIKSWIHNWFTAKERMAEARTGFADHIKKAHSNGGKIILPTTCHRCNHFKGLIRAEEDRLKNAPVVLKAAGIDIGSLRKEDYDFDDDI